MNILHGKEGVLWYTIFPTKQNLFSHLVCQLKYMTLLHMHKLMWKSFLDFNVQIFKYWKKRIVKTFWADMRHLQTVTDLKTLSTKIFRDTMSLDVQLDIVQLILFSQTTLVKKNRIIFQGLFCSKYQISQMIYSIMIMHLLCLLNLKSL